MDFKDWEDSTESEETLQLDHYWIRDIYPTETGIKLMHNICLHHNFLRKPSEVAVVCYTVPERCSIIIKAAGGSFSEDYYTEEGYGTPVFNGEGCLEKAYNFSQTIKELCHG